MTNVTIKLAQPDISDDDRIAVDDVLSSGNLTAGPQTPAFERMVAQEAQCAHGVAVTNGTSAIVLALRAVGVGPGDEVLVPDYTFIATANAVRICGADAVLVDVDANSYNICPQAASRAVTNRTKAILLVDQFGHPADVASLSELTKPNGDSLLLVEDAACAIGAARGSVRCGGDTAIATFSFHPRKVITTGEGGVITTNNARFADIVRQLRNHGRDANGVFVRLAGNERLSEIAAALGRSQVRRLPSLLATRRRLAANYDRLIVDLGLSEQVTPQRGPHREGHAYQSYVVALRNGIDRDATRAKLKTAGIETSGGSLAIHQQAPYATTGAKLPNSTRLSQQTMALPLHTTLTEDEISHVCESLRDAIA